MRIGQIDFADASESVGLRQNVAHMPSIECLTPIGNVQEGVNADAISAEDYLNGKGETVIRKLDKAGTYGIYCEPHSGAGMKGTITVS